MQKIKSLIEINAIWRVKCSQIYDYRLLNIWNIHLKSKSNHFCIHAYKLLELYEQLKNEMNEHDNR